MSKVSVVYWSQSGNTQAMAEAVAAGITEAGKEAEVVYVSDVHSAYDMLYTMRLTLHWQACRTV